MDQAQTLRRIVSQKSDTGIKVLTVTSAKGGVGKSSVAVNLAISLSRRGLRTLIVDMDLGLANIDVMLGIRTKYDLLSVVNQYKDIRDIIETGIYGVKFISGGSGFEELVKLEQRDLKRIIANIMCLDDIVDYIIFDTGAGINDNIIRLVLASDETIIVTTPEPTSMMDAYALVKLLSKKSIKPEFRLIINMAESEKEAINAAEGFIKIAHKYTGLDIESLGYILEDENMVKAVKNQTPITVRDAKSAAAQNIETIADRYMARPIKSAGLSAFFKKLFGDTP